MLNPTGLLQKGIEDGLHLGAQLYVAHRGRVVIDFACGEARPGVAMCTDSLNQWFSSGKPLTAICIAQLYERGELLLEDKVTRFIPEFGAHGKSDITLWHLLTHTAGFRSADDLPRHIEWAESIRLICAAPLEPDWVPGDKAGYSTQAAWFILAEIIQRISGAEFPAYICRELLEPLRMSDTWLRLPEKEYDAYGERVGQMFETIGKPRSAPLQDRAGMAICRPGASARGPISQLARFYSMLLSGGELDGVRIVKPETVELFTQRHRVGLYDNTFAHTLDYGLGFMVNSSRYGVETVPYGYGRFATDETYGHSGAQSSCAFADPKHELVVAWVTNGMPGERRHQVRQRELNSAVYVDLGLAS